MDCFQGQQDNQGSQHQKGKTILDFNGARDDGVALTSARPCKSFAPRCRQTTTQARHHSSVAQ